MQEAPELLLANGDQLTAWEETGKAGKKKKQPKSVETLENGDNETEASNEDHSKETGNGKAAKKYNNGRTQREPSKYKYIPRTEPVVEEIANWDDIPNWDGTTNNEAKEVAAPTEDLDDQDSP